MFDAMERDELQAIYVIGENPVQSEADQHRAKHLLATRDFTVVQDMFLTCTYEGMRSVGGRNEAHIGLAREMGFRNLVFSLQLHGWGDDALAARNAGEMVTLDEGYLQTLISAGDEFGVRVAFWNVADKFDAENMCPWPFERAVVTSDSRTVPCCMIGDPDKFEIARGSTFLQAWKSDEYRDFRLAHIKGKVPSVCKACYR
jgi:hypothetical protein